MTVIGILVLTSALSFEQHRNPASENKEAVKAVSKAVYKQAEIDRYVKKFEQKYFTDEQRKYIGWTTGILKATSEKKVTIEWSF